MNNQENKITLKEVVVYIIKCFKYLKTNAVTILVTSFLFAIVGLYISWVSKPKYEANLSFVLSTGASGNKLSGLASQFGLDLSGGGGDAFSDENMIGLICSDRMIKNALFSSIENRSLINILCAHLKLNENWSKRTRTSNAFPFPKQVEELTGVQDSLVNEICDLIRKQILVVSKPDKKEDIFVLEVTSTDETFAVGLANKLVDVTSKFYIATKVQMASRNLGLIEKEADSLRNLLNNRVYNTDDELDKTYNLNPTKQVGRSNYQKSQISLTVVTSAYAEVLKNLELARITLQRETPLFQIIDSPKSPLKMIKKSRLLGTIGGGILGAFLCMIILIVVKVFKNLMSETL